MKGYKGFSPGLVCRGKQYAENTVFEEDSAEICESGMHFCENPFDVLEHYGFINDKCELNEFAEVEALDESKTDDGKKCCTKKLKIGAKIGIPGLVNAFAEYTLSHVDCSDRGSNTGNRSAAINTGYQSAATNTGDYSAATNTGDWSAATNTGYQSAATNTGDYSAATNTGDWSAATNTGYQSAATNTGYQSAATNTGYQSAATNTGNRSAATNTGNRSAATNTGNRSAATNTGYQSAATNTGYQSAAINTGDRSAATNTGNRSAAINTGYQSAATNTGYQSAAKVEGFESFAIATGIGGKACGKIGCYIAVAEWVRTGTGHKLADFRTAMVDGEKIKEDTFYSLKNGEFVEVDSGNG